ncbi:MAG: hypothetical protein NZ561_02655, partial [Phycisphaerae bacterium]|nr:hypothetical protein [Phycisphaerae bacterium]MDW8261599.1 hypothetical protein [Phycisphaerales bacterium]
MSAAAGKSASPRYADWKAPAEDSRLLIWPEIDELLRQTEQNHNLLAAAAAPRLLGVPLNELRRQARAWIGAIDPQQPIVATGHQTELYHPGVWIKDAVIHFAAERIGGTAWHLAVDTDAPKHLLLRWPGGAMAISDDSRLATAAWSGLLDPPTPAHLAQLRQALHSAAEKMGFEPSALKVLEDMARLALQPTTLSEVLCNVLHGLDWSLGLRHHALLFSPLCLSPPYLSFAASVLADARRFASHYNQALREYRQEQSISGTMRPMPDLFIGPDAVEVPFWLDNLALGTRSRPSVFEECG